MSKKIKILISCHKNCNFVKNEIMEPIQVGTSLAKTKLDMLHDNVGDNISEKNKRYCELTAQYWAWKNIDADYYGFFHYRRYLSFADKIFPRMPFNDVKIKKLDENAIKNFNWNVKHMTQKIEKYDVITPQRSCCINNYLHYKVSRFHFIRDLDFCLDIIRNEFPEMRKAVKKYILSPFAYFCNMFIMKKEIFDKYCEWLFYILNKHEEKFDCKDYGTQAYRVSGFLAERLCGIYLTWLKSNKNIKMKKLQRIKIKNT